MPLWTPVVAFGDARNSRVATFGSNPSRLEFLGRDGNELLDNKGRLETLTSIRERDLTNALDNAIRLISKDAITTSIAALTVGSKSLKRFSNTWTRHTMMARHPAGSRAVGNRSSVDETLAVRSGQPGSTRLCLSRSAALAGKSPTSPPQRHGHYESVRTRSTVGSCRNCLYPALAG